MKDDPRVEADLRALHAPAARDEAAARTLDPVRRSALEARLMAAFDARALAPRPSGAWRGVAVAAGLLVGLGVAARAPAEVPVEVGKRIEISGATRLGELPPEALLKGFSPSWKAQVERRRGAEGLDMLRIDVWGDGLPDDLDARLRAAVPALRGARITVSTFRARVRTSLAAKLAHELFKAGNDPTAVEAARRDLQARLSAGGDRANVKVEALPGGEGHRIVIEVEPGKPR